MKKKVVRIIIKPFKWYASLPQMAKYYIPKGVKYIVK